MRYRTNVRRQKNRRYTWSAEQPEPYIRRRKDHRRARHQSIVRPTFARGGTGLIRPALVLLALVLLAAVIYPRISSFFLSEPLTEFKLEASPDALPVVLPNLSPAQQTALTHEVKAGETLGIIGQRYGFSLEAAQQLDRALRASDKGAALLRRGQKIQLVFDEEGVLRSFQSNLSPGVTLVAALNAYGEFSVERQETPSGDVDRVSVGIITSSFAEAANRTGVSYEIIDELVDLFSDRVVFHRDFRVGDRFTVIYRDRVLEDQTIISSGPVLAAALTVNGREMIAVRYVGSDGKARYFNEKGELLGSAFLRYPVKFSRISSHFSDGRMHPVLGVKRPHNGVDFVAPVGTPIRAVASGTVTFAGWKGPNGILVRIRHSDRYTTAYAHLSKLGPGMKAGVKVQRGDVIGALGGTGRVTGPHLHYAFYDNGKFVDPLKIDLPTIENLSSGQRIHPNYLERATLTLSSYQSMPIEKLHWVPARATN